MNYIHLDGVYDFVHENHKFDIESWKYSNPVEAMEIIYSFSMSACKGIQRANGLQKLLNYPKNFKFDLIIYDYTLGPCLIGFLHHFNYPPVVGVTPFNNPPYTPNIVGGHNYFSYQPYITSSFSNKMTFWERIFNLYLYAVDHL